jgi:hypothetical protein
LSRSNLQKHRIGQRANGENQDKHKTSKGLRVTVNVINKVYQTGRKASSEFKEKIKENMSIKFD